MTEEEKKAVEEKERLEKEAVSANEPTEFEKQLAEKDAKIAKLTEEKDNYRRGMLANKGKNKDGEDIDLSVDEKIAFGIQEALMNSTIAKESAEKDEIIKQALARNKELEIAVKNRSQISTTEGGSGNETKVVPKDNTLSEEKLKQLKSMGWDDKKIERFKQNLKKQA